MPKDWNDMTEAERVAAINARVQAGHTSVTRYQGLLQLRTREQAFDEAITFLEARGYAEAAAELEAAAFEKVA